MKVMLMESASEFMNDSFEFFLGEGYAFMFILVVVVTGLCKGVAYLCKNRPKDGYIKCPKCKSSYWHAQVICPDCGHNRQKGK